MSSGAAPVLVDVGSFVDAPADLIERAVRHTLHAEGKLDVEISVALLPDERIRELNRRFLGDDRPTDVVAFALDGGGATVGDVYVGMDQARLQAEELGVPLEEELARLAIHGALHVLGHDHRGGPERDSSPMFELQERILREVLEGRPNA